MFLVPHQDHPVFAFVIVVLLAAVLMLGIMTVDQAFAELRVRLARGEFIEEE
jgi:hypothetical protein